MFIDDKLSIVPVPGPFVGAGAEALMSRLYDYEDGPIAFQDPSRGLRYQQWRAYLKDYVVWLEADNMPPMELIKTPDNTITDISIAFSNNADLHYVWTDNGVTKLYWYNTATSNFETMTLPGGVRTPKLTLDDKRPTQMARNDIILTYIKSDHKLYFRKQRDRFGVEYLLDDGPFIGIERFYMSTGWRLQWLLTRGTP